MCMLTLLPAGVGCSIELMRELENGCKQNPDGFGYAIVSDDKASLIVYRSMNYADALERFEIDRAKNMLGPAMFHSRWGTHGEESLRNVHPFPVGKDKLTVLAHNGVLPHSTWPTMTGSDAWRSDTNIFAKRFMPSWGMRLDSERFATHVSKFIGSNKIIVLTVNPRYQANAYIWGEKLGDWSPASGAWHSNSGWKGYRTCISTKVTAGERNWWNDDDLDEGAWIGGAYKGRATGNDGIKMNVRNRNYSDSKPSTNGFEKPSDLGPNWLPGRQVVRATSTDGMYGRDADETLFVKGLDGAWRPFKGDAGQRVLTEADVIAAHGYVPVDSDEIDCLIPCPHCGMFATYDVQWSVCSACRMCGECGESVAEQACQCYMPEFIKHKIGASYGY